MLVLSAGDADQISARVFERLKKRIKTMSKPKKRVYAADTRSSLQVHLAAKPSASSKQPADSPHTDEYTVRADEQRQEVINRLIDFFKGL
jgi:hypothetical protein